MAEELPEEQVEMASLLLVFSKEPNVRGKSR
jgi:hypothetical protein